VFIFDKISCELQSKFIVMDKKIKPQDNHANQLNPNRGTKGVNRQYAKVHGNRGKQLNPNQKKIVLSLLLT